MLVINIRPRQKQINLHLIIYTIKEARKDIVIKNNVDKIMPEPCLQYISSKFH
jgi:hypothetical protein